MASIIGSLILFSSITATHQAIAQIKHLDFRKLPYSGYVDRYGPMDWIATKDTLSVLIAGDYLDRTVGRIRIAIGTHKLKPAGGITAFKKQMEVKGKPLVAGAWPQGGIRGLVFVAAEAPLAPDYLFDHEIYAAALTAKGAFRNPHVIYRIPYESGGLYTFSNLVAAHAGDRAAIVFSYYRTVSVDYQWMKTCFVEVSADGTPIGVPVQILSGSTSPTPALLPLELHATSDGWMATFCYRPGGIKAGTGADMDDRLYSCIIPSTAAKPVTITATQIEAYRSNGSVWYSGANFLAEFGKNRNPGLFLQRTITEPDATALHVPYYQTKPAIAQISAGGAFAGAPTAINVPRWEKEEKIYSLPGSNSMVHATDRFSNIVRGSGYTYLVAQVRHGTHSTWPNGGSEAEPEQQYNLYQIDGRNGSAETLGTASFLWSDYYQGRNNTRFGMFEIQKFGAKTGILIHVVYDVGDDLLYALY